ncbi:MAG: glutaredoxin 3 [Geminicoccaceae bacterium]
MSPVVTLYSKSYCPYCQQAKALLKQKGVPFRDIEITDDPVLTAEMKERSGRHTVPQIFIGNFHVGGASDLFELEAAGGLDPLIRSSLAA